MAVPFSFKSSQHSGAEQLKRETDKRPRKRVVVKGFIWLIVVGGLGVVGFMVPSILTVLDKDYAAVEEGLTEKSQEAKPGLLAKLKELTWESVGKAPKDEQGMDDGKAEMRELQAATGAVRPPDEKELFSRVRAIPASDLEGNREGYARLMKLNPENEFYRTKHDYYDAKIKEKEKEFQEQILEVYARFQNNGEALIQELINKGVFQRVGVPGALPRLWVGPSFYEIGLNVKEKIVEAVYDHFLAQNPRYDMVFLFDGETGTKIGIYGQVHGGLKLY